MFKKMLTVLIFTFLIFTKAYAAENPHIEIFDIKKDSVIKEIISNNKLQKEAKNSLNGITCIYGKFKPIPNSGYIIKIPLDSPIKVENKCLKAFIDEVMIIFPEEEPPYLMVFDNEDRFIFLNFKSNINSIKKLLNFK